VHGMLCVVGTRRSAAWLRAGCRSPAHPAGQQEQPAGIRAHAALLRSLPAAYAVLLAQLGGQRCAHKLAPLARGGGEVSLQAGADTEEIRHGPTVRPPAATAHPLRSQAGCCLCKWPRWAAGPDLRVWHHAAAHDQAAAGARPCCWELAGLLLSMAGVVWGAGCCTPNPLTRGSRTTVPATPRIHTPRAGPQPAAGGYCTLRLFRLELDTFALYFILKRALFQLERGRAGAEQQPRRSSEKMGCI
jgi:hypothetical protein